MLKACLLQPFYSPSLVTYVAPYLSKQYRCFFYGYPGVLLTVDLGIVIKYRYVIPERNIRKAKGKMSNEVKCNVAAIDKIKPGNDGNFVWFQNFSVKQVTHKFVNTSDKRSKIINKNVCFCNNVLSSKIRIILCNYSIQLNIRE